MRKPPERSRDRRHRYDPLPIRRAKPLRGRKSPEHNPLVGLDLPESAGGGTSSHLRKRGEGSSRPRLKLLIAGGVMLALLVAMGLNYLLTQAAAPVPPQEAKRPVPLAATQPSRPQAGPGGATSPVDSVRGMLKASTSGQAERAYAYWDIPPDEIAFVKAGQELSVVELVALSEGKADQLQWDRTTFETKPQGDGTVRVVLLRDGPGQYVYSLRKRGQYWRIYNSSAP